MKTQDSWTDDFMAVSSVVVPMLLILLSILTPRSLVDSNQKDTLLTAGITALVTGGFRGLGRKTEINQEVRSQEMNLSPSNDYVQFNPPTPQREANLTPIAPEDANYVEIREHQASAPYKVVSPDQD